MIFILEGLPISSNVALAVRNGRLVPTHAFNSYKKHTTEAISSSIQRQLDTEGLLLAEIQSMASKRLSLRIELYSSSWYNKNDTIKKKDAQNMIKQVIDILFTCLKLYCPSLDDSQLFNVQVVKVYDEAVEDMTRLFITCI